jgi:ABC-2 type transport system permease protein
MGAQSQLILFMFLTALTGSVELVVTRQLGVSRRMFATSTGLWTIVAGEGVARVLLAVLQGVFIVVASALLFGVAWSDLGATTAIILTFGLVSGAAALLIGSLARTPSQAGALAPALGMLFGLFGGTMVTPDVFPETIRTLSKLTPHAWAMDAFAGLGAGGGLVGIAPQLAVLLGYAAILGTMAVLRLRHVLTTGG